MPGGRPTDYKEEYNEQAYKLCLLGATDKELANFFGVVEDTINEWKKVHEQFSVSIKNGKDIADSEVAEKLYQRAKGYSHPDVDIKMYEGEIIVTEITKHYPPDTGAAAFWLKNRQPKKWRDKTDLAVGGSDDMPPIKKKIDLSGLSDEELAVLKKLQNDSRDRTTEP